MVLEAGDLNHAIQLMSQLPCMRVGGSLEIRSGGGTTIVATVPVERPS